MTEEEEAFEPFEVDARDRVLMGEIARLRYRVWLEEGSLDPEAFVGKNEAWLDDEDSHGRHWAVRNDDGRIVAAARLTMHDSFVEGTRDTVLWKDRGLPLPVVDLSRLVVDQSTRGKGVGQKLNVVRIDASRQMGAASIIATASEANARLLCRLGFQRTPILVSFSDRPTVQFVGLEMILSN